MKRLKKTIKTVSLNEAQEASGKYTEATNHLQLLETLMNDRINRIKDEYQVELTQLTEKRNRCFETLEIYGRQQKGTWGKRKSFDLLHSVIGFRTGTPKVTKDKNFSWEDILQIVKEKFPSLVRVKCEIDKEAIIAMRDDKHFNDLQSTCFVNVVQDEVFFVDPKLLEVQNS